jgi:hypothetical protein
MNHLPSLLELGEDLAVKVTPTERLEQLRVAQLAQKFRQERSSD